MSSYPRLHDALDSLGATCEKLRQNAEFSLQTLTDAEQHLREGLGVYSDEPLDVVVLGSLARQEASAHGDMDYLVIAHGLCKQTRSTQQFLKAMDEVCTKTRMEKPGRTGIFARIVAAPELTERIGLEDDTNRTQTHRLLLMLESRSIWNPERHRDLLHAVAERYLADYQQPKAGVPRFLFNDIVRYWRTLTVDYQAKRWRDGEVDWGLRYLKLRITRKLTCAGTMASLLRADQSTPATANYLVEEFFKPPLARLIGLYAKLGSGGKSALLEALEIADRFADFLADGDRRKAAKAAQSKGQLKASFSSAVADCDRLQECLERAFFEDPAIAKNSIRYLSF